MYACMSTAKAGQMTAGNFMAEIEKGESSNLESNLSCLMRGVRGSGEYWACVCSDANAQVIVISF